MREFDNEVTAPHFGYRDADDYYDRASACRVIDQITVPTLIITAQDDPVVPVAIFDRAEVRGNSRITVLAPERGGHCAFISRFAGFERFWAEARVVEFCTAGNETGRVRWRTRPVWLPSADEIGQRVERTLSGS